MTSPLSDPCTVHSCSRRLSSGPPSVTPRPCPRRRAVRYRPLTHVADWDSFFAVLQTAWQSVTKYSKAGTGGAQMLNARDPTGATWQLTKPEARGKGDFYLESRRFSSFSAVKKARRTPPLSMLLPHRLPSLCSFAQRSTASSPPRSQGCQKRVASTSSPLPHSAVTFSRGRRGWPG